MALNRVDIAHTVARVVAPLQRRVRLMVARGIVELVNDATKAQTLQVTLLADEVRSDVERWEQYGLASVPPKGAEALWLSVGGDRSHGAVVAVMDRTVRPTGVLAEGDVALFTRRGVGVHVADQDGSVSLAGAVDAVALAEKVDSAVDDIKGWVDGIVAAINAAPVTPADGGAAFKAAIVANPLWPAATVAPESTAAEKVRAE